MAQKKIAKTGSKRTLATQQYSSTDLDRVKETAYQLWESKGRPSNSALDDWLEAERIQKKSVH